MARLRLEVLIHTPKGIVKHAYVSDGVEQSAFSSADQLEAALAPMVSALADWWHSVGCGDDLPAWRFSTGPEFVAAEERAAAILAKRDGRV